MNLQNHVLAVCLAALVVASCGASDGDRSDGTREGDGGECARFSSHHGGDDTRIHTREQLEELHRSGCTDVPGALRILFIPGVKDLRLVEHIESARFIEISHTTDLESLDGLDNITGVQIVTLTQNDALKDTSALPTPPGGELDASLYVHHNDELQTLEGLDGLTFVDNAISILNNRKLERITAFDTLTSFSEYGGSYVEIRGNPKLPQCEMVRVFEEADIEDRDDVDIWIEDNDTTATCE